MARVRPGKGAGDSANRAFHASLVIRLVSAQKGVVGSWRTFIQPDIDEHSHFEFEGLPQDSSDYDTRSPAGPAAPPFDSTRHLRLTGSRTPFAGRRLTCLARASSSTPVGFTPESVRHVARGPEAKTNRWANPVDVGMLDPQDDPLDTAGMSVAPHRVISNAANFFLCAGMSLSWSRAMTGRPGLEEQQAGAGGIWDSTETPR
jgi:hypothetical protein